MTFGTSSIGFDPADSTQYAAEAAPIFEGPWSGQDRYYLFAVAALCLFLSCFILGLLQYCVP